MWIQNLNEFTMKTAIEDGMLVEFADIVDKDKLAPTVSNMTVEAMPNDNLVRKELRINFPKIQFSAFERRTNNECSVHSKDQQTNER